MDIKKITWKNERRKVSALAPADYNPRMLTDDERLNLEESIKRFSEVEPIVINIGSRNNVLIGGHQRVKIYLDLKIDEVDVRVPDRELILDEEKELNLRLNKNVGSWDWGKLQKFDRDVLSSVGFDQDDLRVNFGLENANSVDFFDENRFVVLSVVPPESVLLKEITKIKFVDIKDYLKVKHAIEQGKITQDDLLKLV